MCDDDEARRLNLIRNERLKLSATYLNGLAVTLFAIGTFGPVIANFNGAASSITVAAAVVSFICGTVSVVLHYVASRLLGGLRP